MAAQQRNDQQTNIAAAYPLAAQVKITERVHSVGVTNRDATNYVEVSFDGTNTAKRLLAGESLIWDNPGRSVWLQGPGSPSAEVFWE